MAVVSAVGDFSFFGDSDFGVGGKTKYGGKPPCYCFRSPGR